MDDDTAPMDPTLFDVDPPWITGPINRDDWLEWQYDITIPQPSWVESFLGKFGRRT